MGVLSVDVGAAVAPEAGMTGVAVLAGDAGGAGGEFSCALAGDAAGLRPGAGVGAGWHSFSMHEGVGVGSGVVLDDGLPGGVPGGGETLVPDEPHVPSSSHVLGTVGVLGAMTFACSQLTNSGRLSPVLTPKTVGHSSPAFVVKVRARICLSSCAFGSVTLCARGRLFATSDPSGQ